MKRPMYPGEFTHVHFSPDGKYLAYVLDSGRLDLWSVETAKQVASNTTTCQKVLGVAFPGDGTALACGRNAQAIQVWKTPGDPVAAPTGHVGIVTAIRFTPDGKELLTAGTDYRLVRWDAASGKELGLVYSRRMHIIPGFERLTAEDAFISPDCKWFVAPIDGGIVVVDVEGKKEQATLRCKGSAPSKWGQLLLSADGSRLFGMAPNFDKGKTGVTACTWDVTEGKLLDEQRLPVKERNEEMTVAEKCFKEKSGDKYPGLPKGTDTAPTLGRQQFDPWTSSGYVGAKLTVKADSGKTLFDADTGCVCKNAVAVSPDGKRLAVGWNDTTVILFDLTAGKK